MYKETLRNKVKTIMQNKPLYNLESTMNNSIMYIEFSLCYIKFI